MICLVFEAFSEAGYGSGFFYDFVFVVLCVFFLVVELYVHRVNANELWMFFFVLYFVFCSLVSRLFCFVLFLLEGM